MNVTPTARAHFHRSTSSFRSDSLLIASSAACCFCCALLRLRRLVEPPPLPLLVFVVLQFVFGLLLLPGVFVLLLLVQMMTWDQSFDCRPSFESCSAVGPAAAGLQRQLGPDMCSLSKCFLSFSNMLLIFFSSSSASRFASALVMRSGCHTRASLRYRRLIVSNKAPGSSPSA